jgi:hypothetical protein
MYSQMNPVAAKLLASYRRWWRIDQLLWGYTRLGLSPFPERLFNSLRAKSPHLVILGTGKSINQINSAGWELIRKFATIGVNDFACHSFVPSAFSVEFFALADHTRYVFENIEREDPGTPTLVKVPWWGTTSSPFPKRLRNRRNFFLQSGTPLTCETAASLEKELKFFHENRSPSQNARRPLDLISSVFRLAYAATYSGFESVSFVGVLNGSTDYYWSHDLSNPLQELKKRENAILLGEGQSPGNGYIANPPGQLDLAQALATLGDFSAKEMGVTMRLIEPNNLTTHLKNLQNS